MVRSLVLLAVFSAGPAMAQGFDGNIKSGFSSGLQSGFSGSISSGLTSNFEKSAKQIGPPTDQFSSQDDPDSLERLSQERQGLVTAGCPPGQVNINRTGCLPQRELVGRAQSTYDTSVQGFAPLDPRVLDRPLDLGAGPQNSID